MENNLKLVKACIYRKGDNYFPVAFMADPLLAEYEDYQHNGEPRVHMLINGMPATNGCVIIPMGRCPLKGKFEMSLTNFEDLLSKYGYNFHCVIPHWNLKDASEVYDAFRWMMYGRNHLPNEDESRGKENEAQQLPRYVSKQGKDIFDKIIRQMYNEHSLMDANIFYRYVHNCSFEEAEAAVYAISM